MPGQVLLPSTPPSTLTVRRVRASIFRSVEEGVALAKPFWNRIATKVMSDAAMNAYSFEDEWPEMREWLGPRIVKDNQESLYYVPNRSFEATIRVKRTEVEDGDISQRLLNANAAGRSAALLPDTLLADLLLNGQSKKAFDGQNFFDANHPVGNGATQSNYTSSGMALNAANFDTAYTAIASFKNYWGKRIDVMPTLLVVPPALRSAAMNIVGTQNLTGGASNPYFGWTEILVVPQLQDQPTAWYLLALDSAALRPFLVQERLAPTFEAKDKDTDDNVFFRDELIYGVRARYGAGYGLWQLAYKAVA